MGQFKIQDVVLNVQEISSASNSLQVRSIPRNYEVTFCSGSGAGNRLAAEIGRHKAPLLLVDQNIRKLYLADQSDLTRVPTFELEAVEERKNIDSVLAVVDFLELNGASKASMLFAVGGGIVQDIGAFASYLYKRGIPWTFVPTTLLAQGDSSVGGKTAVNHKHTKNLLALFSAPRSIITDAGFLPTLPEADWYSGCGEIFRLCVTGGEETLREFERLLPQFASHDLDATTSLVRTSLSVKKAVVEFDEFELDIRRSMNYGHSIGHAIEALSGYRIPHGIGISIGMLVENEISFRRGMLPRADRERLLELGSKVIPAHTWQVFVGLSLNGILDLLKRDKKSEGAVLKLATVAAIGQIRFIDLPLDETGQAEVVAAARSVIESLAR
jgi:3-dehydroquinate synthase